MCIRDSACCVWRTAGRYPCWQNIISRNRTHGSSATARGCFLLSTPSLTEAGAGSAPTPRCRSYATSTITTRTCGPGCWPSRPSLERQQRSSTAPRSSPTSTPCSGRRTAKLLSDKRHSRCSKCQQRYPIGMHKKLFGKSTGYPIPFVVCCST